jgi:hypothetical protein
VYVLLEGGGGAEKKLDESFGVEFSIANCNRGREEVAAV